MDSLNRIRLQRVFAVLIALHALAHLVDPNSPTGFESAFPTVWLAITVLMLGSAVMLWRRSRLAREATIAAAAISLALCATSLPNAVMGLAIDVVLLVLLVFWPWQLVGRSGRLESAQ